MNATNNLDVELAIGEVARRSGLSPATLRFYEEKRLIAPSGRRGLTRMYAPAVLERLGLIALGRTAGFSLDDIGVMLRADGVRIDRQVLLAKADEIERSIARLSAVQEGLRHAAACRAPSHMECPTFQRIVKAAALGQLDTDARRARPSPKRPAR